MMTLGGPVPVSMAENQTTVSRPTVRILTGSKELSNYHLEDPFISNQSFLILVEAYTPEKLTEWKEVVQAQNTFFKEDELLRADKDITEKNRVRGAIRRMLEDKIRDGQISQEEYEYQNNLLYPPEESVDFSEGEYFDHWLVFEAIEKGDEQLIQEDLNKLLSFRKLSVQKEATSIKATKSIVDNLYVSIDNKYFSAQYYEKILASIPGAVYYDEDLFTLVQIYTPEKTVAWKAVMDDHYKKAQDYMLRDANRSKVLNNDLSEAREKLQNGTLARAAFNQELLRIVKQDFLYSYYVKSFKSMMEGSFQQKWFLGDYYKAVSKVEKAIKTGEAKDIQESLNNLLKTRQELQQYDDDYRNSFIMSTVLGAAN